ncbi:angiomotin-like protein 1 isoform X2 [Sitophilus oryzae]|uniref:Angiomotin-like protein 1 isoform X2 n=1 Tax=Sitophilus oryzae TaxID=7048 RepID=A0A6J2XEV1_SITOR|nr:angiomotin-like protein 1 isoform X2 [Sitophilus oryzae]
MQPSNQFRTYPVQLGSAQSHFPQSLSGSETDVSTSNENLSNEEKYVIRHTPRQEPQGQENLQTSNRSSLRESLPSDRSSLDVSSSSYNTLIIHSAGDEPWTGRNSGPTSSSSYIQQNLYSDSKLSPIQKRSSASPSPSITSVQEITEIPDDYLSQSSVLKHLAKEVKVPSPSGGLVGNDTLHDLLGKFDVPFDLHNIPPPPPEYPTKWAEKSPLQMAVSSRNKINSEKLALSKSQPDLTSVGVGKSDFSGFKRGVSAPRPPTKGREENESKGEEVWSSREMVEILIKENSALKHELENCYQRIERTNKLEQEIFKVHKAHEELVQSCERRERLERAARSRLQADCRRYQDFNRALREQVDLLSTQVLSRSPVPDSSGSESLRRELSKREGIIKQLIMQNKELAAAKERQEIELAAQRATLQEQRTHIDILDTALTNAQGNVVRLEEENRKKQVYVERVAQLQRALYSLQLASDRREETERKLRLQLERELQRSKVVPGERKGGWDSPNGLESESASELKRQLREKDENLMRLEGECAKWEQRYLEENALRQAAIDAASIPKDAKIAALEKTSQETEKIIAEARNEKIRHMDEVHAAQKKVADLESRVKDLESKLAEKDAMIRVLQKHTYDKDVSMLGRSPHHTPHASLAGTDIDLGLGATVSREELVSSVLTNSTAYGSGNSYAGSDSSYHMTSYGKYDTNKNFDTSKQTLNSQLKEIDSHLDSQLLSKVGEAETFY